jgi:2-phosphosulfolactate phosphatase
MDFDQHAFDIRCEWGREGIAHLLADSDAIVIVDVLSFSTCVDIAVGNGAVIYPYAGSAEAATSFAESHRALLANRHREAATGYSLAPSSLLTIPHGTRLVLPSPNGSTLSLMTQGKPTFAACLRNAQAVAHVAQTIGSRLSIIPAGERWSDGTMRVAAEDLIGAGAIIHYLSGTRSIEAQLAEATFLRFQADLAPVIQQSGSGQELIGRGFATDVDLAVALNQSNCVPMLIQNAYVAYAT